METVSNGGTMRVLAMPQVVYLDFNGELTSYNGEILTVDHVEVSDSQLTEGRITAIIAELNELYADKM